MIVATGIQSATLTIEAPAEDMTTAIIKRNCIEILGSKYELTPDGSGMTLEEGEIKEIDVSFLIPPLPDTVVSSDLFERMTQKKEHKNSCMFIKELSVLVPDATANFYYQGMVSKWRFCTEPSKDSFDLDEISEMN